eukprot:scaffold634109_cov17-Prasinocladus_malaysianus.AAC.1
MAICDPKTWGLRALPGGAVSMATAAPRRAEPWTLDPSVYVKCVGLCARGCWRSSMIGASVLIVRFTFREARRHAIEHGSSKG